MDELLKMLEGLIQSANINQIKLETKENWKYCVVLSAKGWHAAECKKIQGTNDIVVKWIKEGESDIFLKLSPYDQKKWLECLERSKNEKHK